MIDIQLIRDNPEPVKEKTNQKGYKVDFEKIIELDKKYLKLLPRVENLRRERRQLAESTKGNKPDESQIKKGQKIKAELNPLIDELEKLKTELNTKLSEVPNLTLDGVPVGGEEDYEVVSKNGDTNTGGIDHLELTAKRDLIDFDRGAKVAGNKFYYLKGNIALLENAVVNFAIDVMVKKGFIYMTVPHMVSSRIATGAGFAPRTSEQSDEYFIEGEDLTLIATAEIPLTGYHADEIIDESDLPLKYVGYSPCYRKEAGAYGKHARGLFRVHQFNKLEMYAFTLPEKSTEMHEAIISIEQEIWKLIGIPYRVINIASGDLGAAAAKKYDIEYWSPVDSKYRELTSCSNCTDFQTRNLNIRVKRKDGTVEPAHSLNGTVVAMARTLVAILDNFQLENGSIKVPKVLQKYMGGKEIL
jgi:seryl-tRNA synthetase